MFIIIFRSLNKLYSKDICNVNLFIFLQVVVKPCGGLWRDARGVTFHQRSDVTGIVTTCLSLLSDLEQGDLILVEAFYQSCHQEKGQGPKWSATEDHSNRIDVTVCRGADNKPHVTSVSLQVNVGFTAPIVVVVFNSLYVCSLLFVLFPTGTRV